MFRNANFIQKDPSVDSSNKEEFLLFKYDSTSISYSVNVDIFMQLAFRAASLWWYFLVYKFSHI